MKLTRFNITDFRNLAEMRIQPGPSFNILSGDNGAGKSSVLEAIHTLGTGKSFRVSQTRPLIRIGADRLALFGELGQQGLTIGLEKTAAGQSHIVINGSRVHSASALASLLPVQHLTLHDFQLFEGGPKVRRRFMDWGVFHVEHEAAGDVFRRFDRALKQRNSTLKSGKIKREEKQAWDQEFFKAADALAQWRAGYVDALMASYQNLCQSIPGLAFGEALSIQYMPGWDQKHALQQALEKPSVQERERRTGTTQLGPHRADLRITWHGLPARDMLSRGQMKVLGHGLKLAQIQQMAHKGDQALPIILLDDLAAELDQAHLTEILTLLRSFDTQVFITVMDPDQLPPSDTWAQGAEITQFMITRGKLARSS